MKVCGTADCGGKHYCKGLCRPCYKRAFYLANADRLRAEKREYRAANLDVIRDRNAAQYRKSRDKRLAYDKAYRAANLEKARASDKAYREANREKCLARDRVRYQMTTETHNEKTRAYYKANRAKALEDVAAWRKANPEKTRSYEQKRRAVVADAGTYTAAEWRSILDSYGNTCPGCGATGILLTVDHVVPLSRGGTNTADNLQPLCGVCNARKGNRNTNRLPPWTAPSSERL